MSDYAVRRRSVPGEVALRGCDYADSFEVVLDEADAHSAEQWARTALEGSSPLVRRVIKVVHARVLRFALGPDDEQHVLGWRIAASDQDMLRLETAGPLGQAVIVARRTSPTTSVASTYVFFARPLSRRVWAVVGPLHRALAPYLLRRAARTLTQAREVAA